MVKSKVGVTAKKTTLSVAFFFFFFGVNTHSVAFTEVLSITTKRNRL